MNVPDRVRLGIVVGLIAVGAVFLWSVQRDRARLAGSLEEANTQIDDLAGVVATVSGQVTAMGGEPAVEVERDDEGAVVVVPGPRGESGERGLPGAAPTDAQVQAAVARYCGINDCVGPQGPEPSAFQVAAAVAAYCDGRGECAGPVGAAGSAGETVVGPQGPGPTGEQIAAAVESYCAARDGCSGPAGADGADGEDSEVPGPQGPAGSPGPACPNGADPIVWTVDPARSTVIGLDAGTYLVCRTAGG